MSYYFMSFVTDFIRDGPTDYVSPLKNYTFRTNNVEKQQLRFRSYLLVLGREVRPVQLVDGHHHSHHVFAVQDGDGHDVFGLVLGQLVNKAAEMRALWSRRREDSGGIFSYSVNFSLLAPVTASRLNFDKGADSLRKRYKQMAFHYVHALRPHHCTPATAPPEQQGSSIVFGLQ